MIRTLLIIALALALLAISPPQPIDPALWREYAMTDLRGH